MGEPNCTQSPNHQREFLYVPLLHMCPSSIGRQAILITAGATTAANLNVQSSLIPSRPSLLKLTLHTYRTIVHPTNIQLSVRVTQLLGWTRIILSNLDPRSTNNFGSFQSHSRHSLWKACSSYSMPWLAILGVVPLLLLLLPPHLHLSLRRRNSCRSSYAN